MLTSAPERGEHQNVARAARVMTALAASPEVGLRLTDVAETTGLGSATVHRLLNGLVRHGFVDQQGNRYFLGLQLVAWTAAATTRYGLAPFADAGLDRLCLDTGDTVYFSLISGRDSVCVDRREGRFPIKTLVFTVGDRRPLGVTAGGLALLAFQPDGIRAAILTEDGPRRRQYGFEDLAVSDAVQRTRARGYSAIDGWMIPGMVGVGVPVRRGDGQAVAAISIAAVAARLSGERLTEVVTMLKREAAEIEHLAAAVLETPLARRGAHR